MRIHPQSRLLILVVLLSLGCAGRAQSAPNMEEAVETLLLLCLGKTNTEKLVATGKGDVALTLDKLLKGKGGIEGDVATTFTKEQLVGVVGGISSGLTNLQADQANQVMECIKPYMAGIVKAILEASK